jgi:hypothetical protein
MIAGFRSRSLKPSHGKVSREGNDTGRPDCYLGSVACLQSHQGVGPSRRLLLHVCVCQQTASLRAVALNRYADTWAEATCRAMELQAIGARPVACRWSKLAPSVLSLRSTALSHMTAFLLEGSVFGSVHRCLPSRLPGPIACYIVVCLYADQV